LLKAVQSASCDDLHDFEPVTGFKSAARKLGGRNSLTVMFHDDTAWQKVLSEEEFMDRAWHLHPHLFPVCNHFRATHVTALDVRFPQSLELHQD
jgi:hypothetical protein